MMLACVLTALPIVASPAAELPNGLGIRFVVPPPDASVSENMEGALLSERNPTATPLLIRRTGTSIAISNDRSEPVCTVSLAAGAPQECFGRPLLITEIIPLSPAGSAAHPFVMTATVGGWPVAIYAGLNGIGASDRCRRFVATVSLAATRLAHGVCPDEAIRTAEPIPGTLLHYQAGTQSSHHVYTVRVTAWGGSPQHMEGVSAPSRVLDTLIRCDDIAQLISSGTQAQRASCNRNANGMAWRDTISFTGVQTAQDPSLAVTLRSYRLQIVGTSENTHRSTAETQIWAEAGVPFRTRYTVLAGRGPEGLPPQAEYSETLQQMILPAP